MLSATHSPALLFGWFAAAAQFLFFRAQDMTTTRPIRLC